MVFKHQDGLKFLEEIPDNSVDLILTDPPYITSRDSGMNKPSPQITATGILNSPLRNWSCLWRTFIAYSEMEALVLFSLICGR